MTKKEIKKQQLKAIFAAIKANFNVIADFEDSEGHGYFEFTLEEKGQPMRFMLSRGNFDVISYDVRGDENYELGKELENKLDKLIAGVTAA